MIKRFISLGICLLMVFSAVSSVFAAQPAFTDIDDLQTARDAEVLRLMGVIEGYGDGSFKPANSLTRAQFCKMAICMMGLEQDSAKYSNITIFPDVRASHWAAPYINLAAKGQKIIAGFDDGLFRPNQPITSGQAVTIILRIMGYKDDKVGGVWPDSFMAAGQSIGLLEGCGFTGGRQTITRAQAARLFVNMLTCELYGGGHLFTLTEETTFKSISADTGKMNCSDDVKYELVNKTEDSMLIGMTGKVVLDAKGRALSFIPSENSTGIYEGLVIASADGSTTGFAQLAGGTDYKIYRDGELSSASEIKKWDVATYNPQTKSMRLCSTRLRVYYEDCTGSPKSPETITIMGGKVFPVMDSAKAALAQFKPGQDMYVLFTIDGQVAGAVPVDETDI
ncbi:MAG: S-layer homology domain-containing protein, partial [Firmicutes bacterium]|nr:S-layer homology domain-containing protein [Bacillota bacterium]MBR0441434.1 S-layer homology domain-containing protein [Bacillota bacterium]